MKSNASHVRSQLASAKSNGKAPSEPDTLSEATRDDLDELIILWPTSDDATAAAQAADISNCGIVTTTDFDRTVRGRQIIVATQDTEEGARLAREAGRQCLKYKACSVRIWTLPGFGSKHATMKEWCVHNSLPRTLEMERAAKWQCFAGFAGEGNQECPDFSGVEPRPIAVDLIPVPPLEDAMIPGPFRDWIVDIAKRAWIPTEFPAAAAVVAASGLIGRRLAIRPKRRDRWLVVPNLWGAVVGPAGVLKTPSVEEALRPLKRLAADAIERHKEEEAAYTERKMVSEARKSAAKKKLDEMAKKSADDDHLAELARAAIGSQDPPMPTARRYLVNDVTIEKLGELLAENPHGITFYRDELTGLFKTMERQGHESDRKFFLETWPGTTAGYTFDRIGRGTIHIPSLCVALFGTIQPGPLARYLQRSISGEEADGFIPRFQILVYPDQHIKFLNVDQEPDVKAKNAAYAVFEYLEGLDMTASGCQIDNDLGIPFIGYADDAQDFFDEWRVELENRLRSGSLSNIMAAHLAKYRSLMPSLSLIFHLIDSYQSESLEPVTLEAAMNAAAWCQLLEAHAKRIYQAASDGDPDDAMRLAERIKSSVPNPFTYRVVAKKGWAGLSTSEEVRKAVDILEDRGWVKVVEIPTTERGGRPSEQVWINPKVANDASGVDA